jgi:hypothetical protein
VLPKGLCQRKIPMTPSGIKPTIDNIATAFYLVPEESIRRKLHLATLLKD